MCNVHTQVDSPVTVFDGQILDSTFFIAMLEPTLLTLRDVMTPKGGPFEQGSWAFSLPDESHIMLHLKAILSGGERCAMLF